MPISYPDDDDGDSLRRVAEHGADMSQPMSIEFSINVPDLVRAHSLAERIAPAGFHPEIYVDDETGCVSIYCAKSMLATYQGVVAAQYELNELCALFGADCDGWMTGGNRRDQ